MPRSTSQTNPTFHIIFDSSSIHPSDRDALRFVNGKMRNALHVVRGARDIVSFWYVPTVVKEERLFQMKKAAAMLARPIKQIEQLLRTDLKLSKDRLSQEVE